MDFFYLAEEKSVMNKKRRFRIESSPMRKGLASMISGWAHEVCENNRFEYM